MPILRAIAALAAVSALANVPAPVAAQPVPMPVAVEDVMSIETQASVTRHSNVFAIPDGPADTVVRGVLGLRFDRDVSLQRFSANAQIEPTRYLDHPDYDFVGFRAGANWDWAIGRPLFGQLSARIGRAQSSFYDVDFAQNNLQRVMFLRALGAFRLTQSWSVFAATDHQRLENSAAEQRPADSDITGLEAGLRFSPGTGSEFDFLIRRAEGDYPNRQVRDALGELLRDTLGNLVTIDNAYTEDALLARIGWQPSEAMRLAGQAGWTRRSFDNLGERDFSGPTVGLDLQWQVGGFTTLRADIVRTIVSDDALTSSYVDVQTLAIRPSMQPTARINLEAVLSVSRRNYEGDPGFVLTDASVRRDRLQELGLRANYEVARRIFAYIEARRLMRSSNYDRFEFRDDTVGVGLRALF
jgi:hypothetical protein